ncbi:hypothetical protein Tco_0332485 [Tanacetum coccineum]
MEDDTTHGGFHVESPVGPDDAPTPTADAAGRAEDPALLTSLSAKMRVVKKLEKKVKQLRTTRLVGDDPAAEVDVDIQDDVDLDGLSRIASAALGHDQPAIPSEDVEEREEEEVPLRPNLSAGGLPHTAAVSESASPLVRFGRAEGLAQEYMPNVSEERAKELDDLMMRMTETDWLNLMMQVGSNSALAKELLGADVSEDNFIERMTAVKERKKRALADLRYRALKGKPLKKSEVTQLMRNLVKNQWCAAHNGTITMKEVKALNHKQLVEEYEYICRRLEKDRLLSAQYNFSYQRLPLHCAFRPKPDITEPPSKRQRVERASSHPASVPAAPSPTVDDPDFAGGGSSNSAGGGSSNPVGGAFGAPVTDTTVPTPSAIDSAGSRREIEVSPFADSAASSSPSNVSTDHIPIDVLFASTSGGINDFFLDSDEDEQIGMSRVAADPDSDDEVLAEIIFRGKSILGDGVVLVDKLPDDEIVDPRVKVKTVSDYASSPSRNHRKHLGVRSDDCLWDKPVEDFFSSESESDDDMENYIPPLPYGEFKDWEMVRCPPDFWRTQDDWIVSSWKLYPKSSVHVLDLTNGKTVYMFVDKFYPIRATLLERMLRHRLTTVQAGLRQAYECIASAPIACTARQMVFSSPWLTAKKESGSPLQTALVCTSNPLMVARLPKTGWYSFSMFPVEFGCPEQTATGKDMLNPLYGCDGLPKTVRVFQFTLDSRSEKIRSVFVTQGVCFHQVSTSQDSSSVSAGYIIEFMLEDLEAVPADYVPADLIYRQRCKFTRTLFEFDDEYISSDVNLLFDEELEDIECKVSYDFNLDESTFLVTPLSDSNEDDFFTPRDDIELLLHHDPSISIASILEGFTDEPPLEENDDLFDLESKENDWKKILYDAPIDDLITEDKVFAPWSFVRVFLPTFV